MIPPVTPQTLVWWLRFLVRLLLGEVADDRVG